MQSQPPHLPTSGDANSSPTPSPSCHRLQHKNFQETLRHLLQILHDTSADRWTYAIYWTTSHNYPINNTVIPNTSGPFLAWGDGYYSGGKPDHTPEASSTPEQQHRKCVLHELIGGAPYAPEDLVSDSEWFFLVSMLQSFGSGVGIQGQAVASGRPMWLSGETALALASCQRAVQAQCYGMQTMVCVPVQEGVVELGSTMLICHSDDVVDKVQRVFTTNGSSTNQGN